MSSYLKKAVVQGLATSAVSYATWGKSQVIWNRFGMRKVLPIYIATGALGVLASLVSDGIHELVDSDKTHTRKLEDRDALIIGTVVSAAAFTGGMTLMNQHFLSEYGITTALAAGVASEVLAGAATSYLEDLAIFF